MPTSVLRVWIVAFSFGCSAAAPAGFTPLSISRVHFEPNSMDAVSQVRFVGVGLKHKVYFEDTGVRVVASGDREIRLFWPGGSGKYRIQAEEKMSGTSSYFAGNNHPGWRVGVPHFERIRYSNVYPGIDVVFYGRENELEFDFVVRPGARPRDIRIATEGADGVSLTKGGTLEIRTGPDIWTLRKPFTYQVVGRERRTVTSSYQMTSGGQVRIRLGEYLGTIELVIDPSLQFSTYFGGAATTVIRAVTLDAAGNIYLTGRMGFTPFPGQPLGTGLGIFVTKLSPDGASILYSVYTGGSNLTDAYAIAVDGIGNAYVTGSTRSPDFPVVNPLQSTLGGSDDAFVFKLNPSGTALQYSTYLGGGLADRGNGIAVDGLGNAVITGNTQSTNFPLVSALVSTANIDSNAFTAKISAGGNSLIYSTYLGAGGGYAIAVDGVGNSYIAGSAWPSTTPAVVTTAGAYKTALIGMEDVFVTKLDPTGSTRIYSTFLGTADGEHPHGIGLDAAGNAYIGGTLTTNQGAQQAFLGKLNGTGSALQNWKTLIGSQGRGIAVSPSGEAYLAGNAFFNFPTVDSMQTYAGGDAFAASLSADGNTWRYATLLGGSVSDQAMGIAIDQFGNAVVVGETYSSNFPLLDPLQGSPAAGSYSQGFVTKIAACSFGLAPGSASFGSAGGSGNITVTAVPGCSWTAVSDAPWLTVTSGAAGNGNGTIGYTVSGYPGYASRTATIRTNGVKFQVTQNGLPCIYSLGFAGTNVSRGPGTGTVAVNTGAECSWAASSPKAWVAASAGASGAGSGMATYSYLANTGAARSATLTIAGQPFTINQASALTSTQPQIAEAIVTPLNGLQKRLLAADFNGDGKSDSAVATSTNITILLGDGSGRLTQSTSQTVPISPSQNLNLGKFEIADFNADGKPDLVVSGYATGTPPTVSTWFAVLIGNGDGTLSSPALTPLPQEAYLATVADLNNDHKPDLIFAGVADQYYIYLGNGNGTFGTPQSFGVYPHQTSQDVLAGDLNGDGILDLVVCQPNGSLLGIYRAIAPLQFSVPSFAYLLPVSPIRCFLRDVNSDGKLDLLVGGSGSSGLFTAFGTGAATFLSGPGSPSSIPNQAYAVDFEISDFNGDGKLDAASVHTTSPAGLATVVGDGLGAFDAPQYFPVQFPLDMVLADLNSDGRLDFAVATETSIVVLPNATVPRQGPMKLGTYNGGQWKLDGNGNGMFDAGSDRNFFLGFPGATQFTGDWNGDGKSKAGVYSNGYWFLDYDGNGVWDNGVNDKLIAWGWAGATPVVGDWNGDGATKIGVYSNGFWFLDFNGNFLWEPAGGDKQVGWGWAGVTPIVGDWNGDGRTKIGVYTGGFWFLDFNGNYLWEPNGGDKQVGWGWSGVTPIVGDWNGDGKTKIGVYSGGYWYLDYDGNYVWGYPATDRIWTLGWAGTTPVMGDWSGDGKTKAGAFINGFWYLDYNGSGTFDGAVVDRIFTFGSSGDTPVVGRW